MDAEQLHGIIRSLHAQYNREKAGLAYLDDALTFLLDAKDDIERLTNEKDTLQAALVDLQTQYTTLDGQYTQKRAALDEQHAQYMQDLVDQRAVEHAAFESTTKAHVAACEAYGQEEIQCRAKVLAAQHELDQVEAAKVDTSRQLDTLRSTLKSLRASVLEVQA